MNARSHGTPIWRGFLVILTTIVFAPMLVLLGGCGWRHGPDLVVAGATSTPPKLVTDSSGHFRTRAQWPVGSPLYVGFVRASVDPSWHSSRSLLVRSSLESTSERKWHVERLGVVYAVVAAPWDDGLGLMGTPTAPMDSLRLHRTVTKRTGDRKPSVQTTHHTSTLRVRIEGTVDDVLKPASLPDIDEAIGSRLSPSFHRRGWSSVPKQPCLVVAVMTGCDGDPNDPRNQGMCRDLARHPDVTFAAKFDVLHRGEVMATARAWWRSTGSRVAPYNGELLLEDVAADLHDRDINDGQWSLRVRSDPDTALRDLGSTRYWKGDVTVPLRATDARTWEELKAAGVVAGGGTDVRR
ncbi:MAG: hypothetical protein KF902_11025 [Phycisphaeraceae bacterium]|nr:hypothetical protein [Phycisphaeraceae bacterium]